MEKDLLQAVIRVEDEIHQSIETERKKASEWLESIRKSLSQELEAKKLQLEEDYVQALEATCTECEFKAKKEITDVDKMVEYLQNLPEEYLQNTVQEFLQEILPAQEG